MTPTNLLFLAAFLAACVWGTLFLISWNPVDPQRRAAVVFALVVGQPLLLLLLSARTVGVTGATSVVPHNAALIGQAMNLSMLAVAATLFIWPGEGVGHSARLLIAGVWGMAFALLVANLLSPNPGSARFAFYFAAALAAIVSGVHDRTAFISWARWATRLGVFVSLGAAVVAPNWAFIGSGAQGYDRTLFGVPRLMGLSPHPNAISAIAATGLILEVGFRQGRRWVGIGALLASAVCLLLAQSFTGYVAAGVGLLCIYAVRYASYRAIFASTATVLLAIYVFWPTAIVPASLARSDYVNSVSGRTVIWRLALEEWRRHPVTGYGSNVFSASYLSTHFPANMQQATNAHDQLIQTLADSGLIGVAALVLVLVAALFCAWTARVRDGGLSLALLVVFVSYGITEAPLRVVGVAVVPALVTLIASSLGSRDAAELPVGTTATDGVRAGSALAFPIARQIL